MTQEHVRRKDLCSSMLETSSVYLVGTLEHNGRVRAHKSIVGGHVPIPCLHVLFGLSSAIVMVRTKDTVDSTECR